MDSSAVAEYVVAQPEEVADEPAESVPVIEEAADGEAEPAAQAPARPCCDAAAKVVTLPQAAVAPAASGSPILPIVGAATVLALLLVKVVFGKKSSRGRRSGAQPAPAQGAIANG